MTNPPNPQDPDDPMYDFIDEQPQDEYPVEPQPLSDSSLSHFTTRQFEPENITAALPMIVTITDHGFQNGQGLRASKFIRSPVANATGMEQLNNQFFYVQQSTSDTFALSDANGVYIDGRMYTPYVSGGQFTLSGPTLPVVNPSHFPPEGIV